MDKPDLPLQFTATLQRPAQPGEGEAWAFLVLPREISEPLPRRGRTTVAGTLNGQPFQATLEPDGQLSHWLRVDPPLYEAAGAGPGDVVAVAIKPVDPEPEPALPADLEAALSASPEARSSWDSITTLARVDWIHWIESAKQAKTRQKRVASACDQLAAGKRRVCCFDQSGFYSKGLSAPRAGE